uniref:Uncharacterized protein n=1 Tax=Anguilla anguilla TaxID=7936 RepID=A0A0E9SNZ1_ANGAN
MCSASDGWLFILPPDKHHKDVNIYPLGLN